jgi:hypothetical protein
VANNQVFYFINAPQPFKITPVFDNSRHFIHGLLSPLTKSSLVSKASYLKSKSRQSPSPDEKEIQSGSVSGARLGKTLITFSFA